MVEFLLPPRFGERVKWQRKRGRPPVGKLAQDEWRPDVGALVATGLPVTLARTANASGHISLLKACLALHFLSLK